MKQSVASIKSSQRGPGPRDTWNVRPEDLVSPKVVAALRIWEQPISSPYQSEIRCDSGLPRTFVSDDSIGYGPDSNS